MWNRFVERLKELFGRTSNTKAKSRPGQSGPELQPSLSNQAGTITSTNADRFHAFSELPSSIRNTEAAEAVRCGRVALLKPQSGGNDKGLLVGLRRVTPVTLAKGG